MKVLIGSWLILIGVLHTFIGMWFGRGPLLDILQAGIANTIFLGDLGFAQDPNLPAFIGDLIYMDQPHRLAIFWFLFTGFFAIVIGEALRWLERSGVFPARFGWSLIGLGTLGVVMMPLSGFWTVIILGIFALRRSRGLSRAQ